MERDASGFENSDAILFGSGAHAKAAVEKFIQVYRAKKATLISQSGFRFRLGPGSLISWI